MSCVALIRRSRSVTTASPLWTMDSRPSSSILEGGVLDRSNTSTFLLRTGCVKSGMNAARSASNRDLSVGMLANMEVSLSIDQHRIFHEYNDENTLFSAFRKENTPNEGRDKTKRDYEI